MKELKGMIRIDIDPRILDKEEDSCTELRRKVSDARVGQAEANGYRRGFAAGYEEGLAAGRKIEQEKFVKWSGMFIREEWS